MLQSQSVSDGVNSKCSVGAGGDNKDNHMLTIRYRSCVFFMRGHLEDTSDQSAVEVYEQGPHTLYSSPSKRGSFSMKYSDGIFADGTGPDCDLDLGFKVGYAAKIITGDADESNGMLITANVQATSSNAGHSLRGGFAWRAFVDGWAVPVANSSLQERLGVSVTMSSSNMRHGTVSTDGLDTVQLACAKYNNGVSGSGGECSGEDAWAGATQNTTGFLSIDNRGMSGNVVDEGLGPHAFLFRFSDCGDSQPALPTPNPSPTLPPEPTVMPLQCPPSQEERACDLGPCAKLCEVTAWSAWGSCTVECGSGVASRSREILTAAPDICPTLLSTRECNPQSCPRDCVVSEWGAWTGCDKVCGDQGKSWRVRHVISEAETNGKACPALQEQRQCNHHACAQDCILDVWGPWQPCSKSCGAGVSVRVRGIAKQPAHGGMACPEEGGPGLKQTISCALTPCPRDCQLSPDWFAWSDCSRTCATLTPSFSSIPQDALTYPIVGSRSRSRAVVVSPVFGGLACGPTHEEQQCNTDIPCPIPCVLSSWVEPRPSNCSVRCGSVGSAYRTRVILQAPSIGQGASSCPPLIEEVPCDNGPCPVHCEVDEWSPWGECDRSCVAIGATDAEMPTQSSTRNIITPQKNGGDICPPLVRKRLCPPTLLSPTSASSTSPAGYPLCPSDCLQSEWSSWCHCSKSCQDTESTSAPGVQSRHRILLRPNLFGGVSCGPFNETRECGLEVQCPEDCKVSQWDSWSDCSRTCEVGVRSRQRTILHPDRFGGSECPPTREVVNCVDEALCPRNCTVGEWNAWGSCSSSCGGSGMRARSRNILAKGAGGYFDDAVYCPPTSQMEGCGEQPCPIDCVASANYSAWTEKDPATPRLCHPEGCHKGSYAVVTRKKKVLVQAQYGGAQCTNLTLSREVKPWGGTVGEDGPVCRTNMHIHGNWSECTRLCGRGKQCREVEDLFCSQTAALKYHFTYHSCRPCNTNRCETGADASIIYPLEIPPIPSPIGLKQFHKKMVNPSPATYPFEHQNAIKATAHENSQYIYVHPPRHEKSAFAAEEQT